MLEYLNAAVAADAKYAPAYEEFYAYYIDVKRDLADAERYGQLYVSNSDPSPDNDYILASICYLKKDYQCAINAANKIVQPQKLTWVIVGDKTKIEKGIQELNLGPVKYIDSEGVERKEVEDPNITTLVSPSATVPSGEQSYSAQSATHPALLVACVCVCLSNRGELSWPVYQLCRAVGNFIHKLRYMTVSCLWPQRVRHVLR